MVEGDEEYNNDEIGGVVNDDDDDVVDNEGGGFSDEHLNGIPLMYSHLALHIYIYM